MHQVNEIVTIYIYNKHKKVEAHTRYFHCCENPSILLVSILERSISLETFISCQKCGRFTICLLYNCLLYGYLLMRNSTENRPFLVHNGCTQAPQRQWKPWRKTRRSQKNVNIVIPDESQHNTGDKSEYHEKSKPRRKSKATVITSRPLGQNLHVRPLFNIEFQDNSEYCIKKSFQWPSIGV